MTNFEFALRRTVKFEGGYTVDNGGPTQWGITQTELTAYQVRTGNLWGRQIQDLTVPEASQIYKSEYWNIMNLDRVDDRDVAAEIFDTGVNCGPATGVKIFQRALNILRHDNAPLLTEDGNLGPKTLCAYRWLMDNGYKLHLLYAMNGEQYCYYREIGLHNERLREAAMRGWMRRLEMPIT
jgi:lysozyme family protein